MNMKKKKQTQDRTEHNHTNMYVDVFRVSVLCVCVCFCGFILLIPAVHACTAFVYTEWPHDAWRDDYQQDDDRVHPSLSTACILSL